MRIQLQFFSNAGDKTEKATPKKRQDLRKKGQVNQSREIPSILLLLSMFLSMRLFGTFLLREIEATFRFYFEETASAPDLESATEVMRLLTFSLLQMAKITGPFFLIAMVIGAVGSIVQVGFLFTLEPRQPKFSKINPFAGMKRLFSKRSLFEMVKSMAKVGIVLWVAWGSISAELGTMSGLMDLALQPAMGYMAKVTLDIAIKVCFALLVIAIVDFLFQYFQHEKEIRMTKQEVKEEYKQMEGSPEIRSRIRQKQREISMRRMMQEVPKADVVITNPTHLAVAVKYDPKTGDAPVVLAKGADFLAARIREKAKESGVRIVENKPLAQALYNEVDVGKPIPQSLYRAVAEVLAFVYGLQGKGAPARPAGTPPGSGTGASARRSARGAAPGRG